MKLDVKKLAYLLGSLALALLLSVYTTGKSETYSSRATNATSEKTSTNFFSGLTTNKTETVTVPLQLNGIDTDKYLITGVPDTVKVKLSGSSALVTAAQNTKNFSVYADLKKLTDGEHNINLKVSGLNKELTYKLDTKTISVAIYKRATAYYTVKPSYNEDAIADGYKVGDVTSSVTNVEVMGRASLVDSVARVVAAVQLPRDTNKTTTHHVTLQALDAAGNAVDVAISPEVTTVRIPVSAGTGTKSLPIKFATSNGTAKNFDITANVNEVTVNGNMDVLEKLDSVTANVNLANITAETQQTVTINTPDGADSIDPNQITVTITPKEQEN